MASFPSGEADFSGGINAGPYLPTASASLSCILAGLAKAGVLTKQLHKSEHASSNEIFVDLGCGDGRVCFEVAQRFGYVSVGVEYDREVLENALREHTSVALQKSTTGSGSACTDFEFIPYDTAKPAETNEATPASSADSSKTAFLCCDMFLLLDYHSDSASHAEKPPADASHSKPPDSQMLVSRSWSHLRLGSPYFLLRKCATVVFLYLLPDFHDMLGLRFQELFSSPDSPLRVVVSWWWPVSTLNCRQVIADEEGGGQAFVYLREDNQNDGSGLDRDSC